MNETSNESIYLSVIIPCYNEEDRIGKTLERIYSFLKEKPYTWEILVVDNGSTDRTRLLVGDYADRIKNLYLLVHQSHGKGWAIKQGMLEARGEYRLFTDADNSTDIAELDRLLPWATHGADVVISSRKKEDSVIVEKQPFYRLWLGNLFPLTVKLFVPMLRDIKDTQNGFKLFTRQAAEKIFPHQTIFYWAFDVEVLALAKMFDFKISEVGIVWKNDDKSKMNLKGMLRAGFEVILTGLHFLTFDFDKLRRSRESHRENRELYARETAVLTSARA
jgi:dolichyl-phosphate beta-glucosyltransferase